MSERTHFIPLRRKDLVDRLCADRDAQFAEVADAIHHRIRFEADERAEALRDAYAPFDPDPVAVGTRPAGSPDDARRFLAAADEILRASNFRQVTQAELDAAFAAPSMFPLQPKVDISEYEILRVYRRGTRDIEERYRGLKTLWRWRTRTVTLWERLALVIRMNDTYLADAATARTEGMEPGLIYLKSFKNIPTTDVEMVLPNTRLKLRRIDQLMIGGPLIAGVGWTVVQSIGILIAVATGAFALSLDDPRIKAAGGVLLAIAGYLWKTHGKVKNTRLQYMQTLSQGLYFRNLANNRAVLHQLLAFARDADEKEALLTYAMLLDQGPMRRTQLDAAAEAWITAQTGRQADFDVRGGLALLEAWGLVEKRLMRWSARDVPAALDAMTRRTS